MVAAVIAGAAVVATVVKHFGPLAMAEFNRLHRLDSNDRSEKENIKKVDYVLGNRLSEAEVDNAVQIATARTSIKSGPGQ